jgi:hypothetical protein
MKAAREKDQMIYKGKPLRITHILNRNLKNKKDMKRGISSSEENNFNP